MTSRDRKNRDHRKIESILFPTDFSPESRSALLDATAWARRFAARLHLLHVVVPYESISQPVGPAATAPASESVTSAMKHAASRHLSQMVEELPEPTPPLESQCSRGPAPAPVIVAYAEEKDVDLVVMSSHGRRGLRRLFIGSVTEEVVRRSPCPVLVERRAAHRQAGSGIDRILVPIDFSEPSHDSLARALDLAAVWNASVDLLTVIHEPAYPPFYASLEAPTPVPQPEAVEERAREALERLRREAAEHVTVETFLRRGPTALSIVEQARDSRSDLIVLATHGLTGLSRLLLGSVTEQVLRRAECPVLVVPAAISFEESDAECEESSGEPELSGAGA